MELETRFARPDDETISALVRECVPGDGDGFDLVETGSSSVVALTETAAVRIARDRDAAREILRTQALVDHLPALPFDVPTSLGRPVWHGDVVAVATRRLEGEPHPAGSGDAGELRALLDAIHGIDVEPLRGWLAEPHAFCGGAQWLTVLRERVVPLLPSGKQAAALDIVARVEALPAGEQALNHGDLAGANVLWREGRVAGVLDWDLAAWCDPADDVASLALWHGWDVLPQLADAATAQRADVIRQTYPLQVVGFTVVRERPADELSRAVDRAAERLA